MWGMGDLGKGWPAGRGCGFFSGIGGARLRSGESGDGLLSGGLTARLVGEFEGSGLRLWFAGERFARSSLRRL